MPRQRCQINDKPGWKWGDEGKCYTYGPGTDRSEGDAIRLAEKQGAAIGYSEMSLFDFISLRKEEIAQFDEGGAIEIFDLDGVGQGHDWPKSKEDLQAIADTYDPSFSEAGLNYDHKHDGPALGWVENVWREGRKLFAKVRNLSEDLKENVRHGRYKKVSMEAFRPGHPMFNESSPLNGQPYLAGVAFLGAKRPAVKGLAPLPQFSDEAINNLVYFDMPGRAQIAMFESEENDMPNEQNVQTPDTGVSVEQFAELKQQVTSLQAENEDLKKQVAEYAEKEKANHRAQRTAKFENWLDGDLKTKYVQAKRADILATFEALPDEDHENRLFEALKEAPDKVEFGESGASPPPQPDVADDDYEDVAKKVKEYQAKHNIATFAEAYDKCMARA